MNRHKDQANELYEALLNRQQTWPRNAATLAEWTSDCDTPERDNRPVKFSDNIYSLRQIVRKAARKGITHLRIVIYCRVSSGKQGRDGNLDHQLRYVRRRIQRLSERYGVTIEVVDEFDEEVSAWKFWSRPELVKAADLASEKGAVLVALNTSRLVRNRHHERQVMPTVDDFEKLMWLVGNVQLATIDDPDQHEDRGADTIRGHKARGAKPGRPKKRTKEQRKRLARWLHGRGWVIRDIAAKRMVSASKSTVGRWLNE